MGIKLLQGKAVAEKIRQECLDFIYQHNGIMPCLAFLRIGERAADIAYERGIKKTFVDFGMEVKDYVFPQNISDQEFQAAFDFINDDPEIDGILITMFRPLPAQIDIEEILRKLHPEKDIDGVTDKNLSGLMREDENAFAPCTAEAVVRILRHYEIPLAGKHVAVLGRSMVVGRPLSMLLLSEDASCTVLHSKSENTPEITKQADILVAAIGKANAIGSRYIKKDAVVIDVGVNVREDGKLTGDCDFDTMEGKAAAITPVPGGVGPVTTAILARHLMLAKKRSLEKTRKREDLLSGGREKTDF